jgi:hypothetical protein
VTLQATTNGASTPVSTSFSLTVTAHPDFVLTETGTFPEVIVGSTGTTGTISVAALDGFSGTVTLSCPATYGAGSCSINPSAVNSFPANATLTINGTAFAAGPYTLTISGTSGSTTHTLPVAFSVGDYTISGMQPVSGTSGTRVTANIQLSSIYSYSGKINAGCDSGSLPGGKCSLSPPNPIIVAAGGSATVTAMVDIPTDAAAGSYDIKVNTQDSTGAPNHNVTIALSVVQDFLVSSATASQTVAAGQTSGPYALTVRPIGASFNAPITLVCTAGLPAGAQCIFNPSTPVTPGSSAVDVVMNISTAARNARAQASVHPNLYPPTLAVLLLAMAGSIAACGKGSKRMRYAAGAVGVSFAVSLLLSCAGVSNGGGDGGQPPPPPLTYHITVTGTSAGTPADAGQSTKVALVIN